MTVQKVLKFGLRRYLSHDDPKDCCKLLILSGADFAAKSDNNQMPIELNNCKSLMEEMPELFSNFHSQTNIQSVKQAVVKSQMTSHIILCALEFIYTA